MHLTFFKNQIQSVDAEIDDLPARLGGRWGGTVKFQMGRYVLLHIAGKVFL